MDLDITVQMMNDRIGFQFESIIQSTSGEDVLQKALDDQSYLQSSDTQVEIGINVNELYSSSATVDTIKDYLDNSYSLILPNKRGSLEPGDFGYLRVDNESSYLDSLREYSEQDIYSQNSRQRYPKHTLVGSFRTKQQTRNELGVQANEDEINDLKDRVNVLEANVRLLFGLLSNATNGLEFHHKYIEIMWNSIYGEELNEVYAEECVDQDIHEILEIDFGEIPEVNLTND